MRRPRTLRPLLLTSLVLGALLPRPFRPAYAEDKPTPAAPASPGAPAAPETPKRRPLDAKERTTFVGLLHTYLDVADTLQFAKGRLNLMQELKRLKDGGCDPLADLDALLSMIYAARSFEPPYEKKILPKEAKDAEIFADPATSTINVNWPGTAGAEALRLSVSLPAGYVDLAKNKKLSTTPPFPTIVTLHELDDFQDAKGTKKFPGLEVIKRRYDRKTMKALTDAWFVVAPVATRARFVDEDGKLRHERVTVPLSDFWKRYHVDYNRIVLDGGSDALQFAACQPVFYAGLIVRSDTATLKVPELARNFAHMAVYVVGSAEGACAKGLVAGGFPKEHLTCGDAAGIADWLGKLPKRTIPKSFRWCVADPDAHAGALWVNLESFDLQAAPVPNLDVQVVDTAEDPNTVKIRAEGVRTLSLFLSDAILDLDRDVRVVVNGTPVGEIRLPSTSSPQSKLVKLPARFDRTLDGMFDTRQISIRKSQFFGWLFPVSLQQIAVKSDVKDGPEAVDPNAATGPEKLAQQYFAKAEEKEKAGDLNKALDLYKKAAAQGETSVLAKAEAKVTELAAKVGGK